MSQATALSISPRHMNADDLASRIAHLRKLEKRLYEDMGVLRDRVEASKRSDMVALHDWYVTTETWKQVQDDILSLELEAQSRASLVADMVAILRPVPSFLDVASQRQASISLNGAR